MRSKWPRNFDWRSLGGGGRAILPAPPFPSARGTRGNRMPQGPHTRPLFPMGQPSNLLARHAGRPLQVVVLGPFPSGGGVPRPRGSVLVTPQSRCAALRCRGGRAGPATGRRRPCGGGDVPFPLPPSRRRCAGSGLAPGARGARGEGVSSRHALVKGVIRVDRSCRRWVVFAWYYYPTRALRPW